MKRLVVLASLAFAAALVGNARLASALTLAPMTLEQLTGTASIVVRARCIDRTVTRSPDGRIESLARFEVVTRAKGDSPDVVTVDGLFTPGQKADALVTAQPGVALSVLTADCQPVLFADPLARVIGAAHAGWRGALSGVLERTIEAMEALGAKRVNIHAVIGPTISQRAYEVGPEFMDAFLAEDPDHDRFFAGGQGDRVHFDLPGFGLHRLREAGVGLAAWTGHCTYSDPALFFSYRRSVHQHEADYGRLISAIRL